MLMVVAPCQAGSYEICFSIYTIVFNSSSETIRFYPKKSLLFRRHHMSFISYECVLFYKLLSTGSFIGLD